MKKIYFGLAALALSLAMITGCSAPNSEGPGGITPPITGSQLPIYSFVSLNPPVTVGIYHEYDQYIAIISVEDLQTGKSIGLTSGALTVNGSEYNGSISKLIDTSDHYQKYLSPNGHIKITVSETTGNLELSYLTSPFDVFNKSYNNIPVYDLQ